MVNSWRVQQAAREVRAGAVIAYPTEAVWGLGCDPWNEDAVDRLLAIKNRSVSKGLILVADNIRQFDFLFEDFPQDWIDRMASTWPGPNTGWCRTRTCCRNGSQACMTPWRCESAITRRCATCARWSGR